MVEDNVALMRRWFHEVWNERRRETIFEIFAEDGVAHWFADTGGDLRSPKEFIPYFERLCAAFSDIRMTVDDCFGAGDKVAVRWSVEMRHTGDSLGIRATGKSVGTHGLTMVRFADGKAIEAWECWDKLGLLTQLEAVNLKVG
jgi:steroid delta-isomerase-like uncharacterized protein